MKKWRGYLEALLFLAFWGAGLLSLLAYFGQFHHLLELTTHFRMQYFCVLALSGLIFILLHLKRWIVPYVILLVVAGAPIFPYYFPPAKPVSTNLAFRLMNVNVLKENEHYDLLGQAIQKHQPDILALQEPDRFWLAALNPYVKNYPYRKLIPQDNNFGIAIYSKIPVAQFEEKRFGAAYLGVKFPSILARLTWANRHFSVLVTHPLPPAGGFSVRNSQLADMARQRSQFGENLIMTGDLNTSQWSPFFQQLLKQADMRDTQVGFGVQPSWMVNDPRIAIPIDHVLVSPKFQVINRQVGPDIGSDHRPVIVDLTLSP